MPESVISSDQLARLCAVALDLLERTILVSDHKTVLYANPATARLLRANSASELIGLPAEQLSHPDSRSAAHLRRTIAEELGQGLSELPTKIVARDGTIYSGITDMCPISFQEQVAFVYTGRIPSDRKSPNGHSRAAADRANRKSMFETIAEVVPDIIMIHNEELVLFANAACRRFLAAQSPADIEGRPVDIVVHADSFAAGRERRQLLLEGGSPIKGIPVKIVSLDNQTKHVTVNAYPLAVDGHVPAAAIIAPASAV